MNTIDNYSREQKRAANCNSAQTPFEQTLKLRIFKLNYQGITSTMSLQTPRVLPSHLHAFHPSSNSGGARPSTQTVRLLGTVTALRGETATITCGNHGDVTLLLKPDSHLQMGKLVEVVGKVTELDGGQVSWREHSTCPERKSLTRTCFPLLTGSWSACPGIDRLGESC